MDAGFKGYGLDMAVTSILKGTTNGVWPVMGKEKLNE